VAHAELLLCPIARYTYRALNRLEVETVGISCDYD